MLKIIKNVDSVMGIWCGQELQPEETYTIPANLDVKWANDSLVLSDIVNGKLTINDITDVNLAIDTLKNNMPITVVGEITPLTIKNNHTMQPFGCEKGAFSPALNTCAITLSNKSIDGLTFSYNTDVLTEPTIGNYVFQSEFTRRSWITEVDVINHTVTFEKAYLDDGVGFYSKGIYLDCEVRDWHSVMYLWGLDFKTRGGNYDDFIEFSVVDRDDLFLNNTVTQTLFGVDAVDAESYLLDMGFELNGEYGHWTKYFDEQWTFNSCGKSLKSPDGAPGALMSGLYLRMAYFSTFSVEAKTHFYVDYYFTAKDGE